MARNSWDDFRKEKQRQRQEEAKGKKHPEPRRQAESEDDFEDEEEPVTVDFAQPRIQEDTDEEEADLQPEREIHLIDLAVPPDLRKTDFEQDGLTGSMKNGSRRKSARPSPRPSRVETDEDAEILEPLTFGKAAEEPSEDEEELQPAHGTAAGKASRRNETMQTVRLERKTQQSQATAENRSDRPGRSGTAGRERTGPSSSQETVRKGRTGSSSSQEAARQGRTGSSSSQGTSRQRRAEASSYRGTARQGRAGASSASGKSAQPVRRRQTASPYPAQLKAARKANKQAIKLRKAQEREERRANKPQPTARQLRRRRRLYARIALFTLLAALFGFSAYYYVARRTYHGYKVIKYSEQEDVVSTGYLPMNGKILRYNTNEVSLVDASLNTQWIESYTMTNPIADVRGDHAVIADRDGTLLLMVGPSGITGRVSTSYAIVKACVSQSGLVAAILDGGSDTWINFYGSDGSLIAENQTTMEDPGYPMDVDLSDNGTLMMVSYQFIDGSKTTSYVAFYNFGDAGQNSDDRIVSGFTYEGKLVPQIQCLDPSRSVAFRDDGFVIYYGNQVPNESKTVKVSKEIISTFYDENNIGLVFKNDNKDKQYTMQVYGTNGELKFSKDFNVPYTTIKMSDGYIIMYNSGQLSIVSSSGSERFMGSVDGTINNCAKLGLNRYLLIMDNGVNIIRFT